MLVDIRTRTHSIYIDLFDGSTGTDSTIAHAGTISVIHGTGNSRLHRRQERFLGNRKLPY